MINAINDVARYIIEHRNDIKNMNAYEVFNQWSENNTVTIVDEEHIAEFCKFIEAFIFATNTDCDLMKECISYDGN